MKDIDILRSANFLATIVSIYYTKYLFTVQVLKGCRTSWSYSLFKDKHQGIIIDVLSGIATLTNCQCSARGTTLQIADQCPFIENNVVGLLFVQDMMI